MNADALMSLCIVVLPAVLIWALWAYTLGTQRQRKQLVHMQNEVISLREGETFVGVIEREKGQYTFIVHDVTDSTNDA
jgi:hypothetical protein